MRTRAAPKIPEQDRTQALQSFVAKWRSSSGAERANKDSFLNDLCSALGVPAPHPTTGDSKRDTYVFEKSVRVSREGAAPTTKWIDLYKHGCFTLEAKQGSEANTGKLGTAKRGSPAWNVAMDKAYKQACEYTKWLDEPPPFVIIVDIGYCLDLYAAFDGSTNYRVFPNALGHRLYMSEIEKHAPSLRSIFTNPLSLDPAHKAIAVTREVADHLANLSKALESAGYGPQTVAAFLMRCIFTMFAEDVGLLPDKVFSEALKTRWLKEPKSFPEGVETLWRAMNDGTAFGFFGKLLHFNGGLFRLPSALPLKNTDLQILSDASRCRWRDVEPAIFGALFENALNVTQRHQLGAHFTPRAYVERLVRPTLEEPLRAEWRDVQTKAGDLVTSNKLGSAKGLVRAFLTRLSEVRVLDPACGTGNFLYVAMDVLKALEDEALSFLRALEQGQTDFYLDTPEVTPRQLLGIEINPRAKEIAELVLWIGYLQWHFRTAHRSGMPREPVLQDYKNIQCCDALLQHSGQELTRNDRGVPVTRWDGETMKRHSATSELVPDESHTLPVYRYLSPRKFPWPTADFIVGNPPFIGNKRMRLLLGDGYVEALRKAYTDVPATSDYVMYWWNEAARCVRAGTTQRFGLITTNTFPQKHHNRLVRTYLGGEPKLSFVYAVNDHPWVEAANGAAVRISMTVGRAGEHDGTLLTLKRETPGLNDLGERDLEWVTANGRIGPDLRIGHDVRMATPLRANSGLCQQGVKLVGPRNADGFVIQEQDVRRFGGADGVIIKPYISNKEALHTPKRRCVIDFFPLDKAAARRRHPRAFQRLLDQVYPFRAQNRDPQRRRDWWLFGRSNERMRASLAGLQRFIVTPEVAKHRPFMFVDASTVPDASLYAVGSDDAYMLGVLSSRIHLVWALPAGGRLGAGNDPRYQNGACFDPFPFPAGTQAQVHAIRDVAETLDAHRKHQQAEHPELTITGMYNILEKLRTNEELDDDERVTHEHGLVSVLQQLHDELDAAVFTAYGWPNVLTDEQIIGELIKLNAERSREELVGKVRWLRPAFQNEGEGDTPRTAENDVQHGVDSGGSEVPARRVKVVAKISAATQIGSRSNAAARARKLDEGNTTRRRKARPKR